MSIRSYFSVDVLIPFASIYGVGCATLLILPFLYGAILSHYQISEAQAGLLVSVELGAMCLGSLIAASLVNRYSKRMLACLGWLLAFAGNVLLILFEDYYLAYSFFTIAGLGCGLALAAGNAQIASSSGDPTDIYSKTILLGTALMVLLLNIFPRVIAHWSLPGALMGLVILQVLMLPLILRMDARIQTEQAEAASAPEAYAKGMILLKPLALAIVLMTFFYFVRDTLVWVFAENIGRERIGLDSEYIGLLFSVHGLLSLMGPILLLYFSRKFNKHNLLFMGIFLTGGITVWISMTSSAFAYSGLAILWSTAHFFTYGCIMGLATSVDKSGQIAAAAGAAVMGGNAVAPAIAGYAMAVGGPELFGASVVVAVTATFLCGVASVFLSRSHAI